MSVDEFQEIGHCGGQYAVIIKTDEEGKRSFSTRIQHSRPTPFAVVAIYSLPQGVPVSMMEIRGIGQPSNPPPISGCIPVFFACDSHGKFGHSCLACEGYWRSNGPPAIWELTCPYCGNRDEGHHFLTTGQRNYVKACCELIGQAMDSPEDGEFIIDMDETADAVSKGAEKPPFYYAEQSQQNKYDCLECGAFNDILGRYGYCSNCGTHNGFQEISKDIEYIQNKITQDKQYEASTKDAVAVFDSFARQIAKRLANQIPMTPGRRKDLERRVFHNLLSSAEYFEGVFDIKLFKGMKKDEINFACLMFHRRHVYEHNGGEVDAKYIRDSGDKTVRPKQVIRETHDSSLRVTELVLTMAKNLHDGFHSIFPVVEIPIKYHKDRQEYLKTL